MSKYAQLITASDADREKTLAPARAKEQQGSLGLEIAKLDLNVQTKRNDLEELKGNYPLDVDSIVESGDELDLATRRLDQLKRLSAELFDDTPA